MPRLWPVRLWPLRPWHLLLATAALAFGLACGGGDDPAPTATETPGHTSTPAPTPPPRWPEVARAKITTEDLNVRTGPGGTYPVVGRLQPDDDVAIAGRLQGGDWLAIPGAGWIAYEAAWMQLSVEFAKLPAITGPETGFEFAGPVYPTNARSGIPVVDHVVAAVAGRDRNLLLSLATAAPPSPSGTPSATSTPDLLPTFVPTLVPDVTQTPGPTTPTPTGTATPTNCSANPIPGVQLRDYLDALYTTKVPAASRGGDTGVLRLYGVVRGAVPQGGTADYVVVFAFEHGEGRQVWVSPDGRITQFTIPCEPTLPGSLLRVTQGEPYYWFRPAVTAPVRALP